MKPLRYLVIAIGILSLAACQTMDGILEDFDSLQLPALMSGEDSADNLTYSGHCPAVDKMHELSMLSEFTNPSDPSEENLISRAAIANLETTCNYDERSVTVDLKMTFDGILGPRGRSSENDKPFYSYPFFIAIAENNGRILAKEIFAASMTYDRGENRHTYYENMRQIIPLEYRDRGNRYKIIIGFQLSPDQLAYNRRQIRNKKASAQTMDTTDANAPTPLTP